ncbi:MAG: Fic family protein [Deltaproteobacteria bacterium]|nr:Fic family protein [Deltaproteobacteria bacterium]
MAPAYYHEGGFPPEKLEWEHLIPLIGPASAAVARYDGILSAVPNASVLLSPLTTREAVLSSRIEGTQATMGEVLEYEAGGDSDKLSPERTADIHEILNYRQAMRTSESMLKDLPLCQRIVKESHRILLTGVRGHGRSPGEYRKTPNWIGPPGCSIEEARFVPISADKLPKAMSSWEKYLHADAPDRLIQLAIIHAEFEALHPFLDGNGRLGRMLVPLFMYQAEMISSPMFYISAYLEAHRDEYYERLMRVSSESAWTDWCIFFLKAIREQANENQRKAGDILNLYEQMKSKFVDLTHSQYAILALDWIFERPIFKSTDFVRSAGIPKPTAFRILSVLKKNGILKDIRQAKGRTAAIFMYTELLNIADGYDAF